MKNINSSDWAAVMDVRQLRYFATLAEEKHFGRAAKRLGMSQPPLSLAIRQIEAELQTPLFSRNSRNVELTRAGVALQREARLLLRQFDEAKALVRAVAEGKEGRLRVGFGGSMIWFGSSAGVALSNMYPQGKSVGLWLRHGWHVSLAYVIGFFVLLTVLGWQPHAPHKDKAAIRPPAAAAGLNFTS